MVLKFCGGLWDASHTDDDLDAASSRQRRLHELLREGTGSRHVTKFKKEVRIIFDSARPHGIDFVHDDDSSTSHGYVCRVASMDTNASGPGQAAEYNNRCKAIGDYAHLVVDGMRVRSVDGVDMKDVAFEDVVQRVTKGCVGVTGCAITFADVSSTPLSPRPKLRAVGNVVLAAQRTQQLAQKLTMSQSPTSPTSRRSVFNTHASPKVSKWSSVLTAVTESTKANQSDVLASDLVHKNTHLEAQLLVLKGKIATLEREKCALDQLHDHSATNSTGRLERLEVERLSLQTELTKVNELHTSASHENAKLSTENAMMKTEIEALQSAMEKLQHEHDGLLLQMHELQIEHRDVQHQAEELHNRLVAAQLVKSELNEQLTMLKYQQSKELSTLAVIQAEWTSADATSTNGTASQSAGQPRHSAAGLVAFEDDSPAIALLKQMLQSRTALQAQHDELQIELSCHETTLQHQQDKLIEVEDKLTAVTQINDSLRDQVRALMATTKEPTTQAEDDATTTKPTETTPATTTTDDDQIRERLERQLAAERSANARIQSALQALEDKARANLEQHAKEQLFLSQFKDQLVKGITITKYGARGNPHVRVLFSDAQCSWLSWRSPSDGSTSPRADAKAETLDLVEVLLGATTETFAQYKPEVPARCLSLVFCHPCRTLDVEVETRDRALFLRRGFRLLLEDAAEKRRRHEDEATN